MDKNPYIIKPDIQLIIRVVSKDRHYLRRHIFQT